MRAGARDQVCGLKLCELRLGGFLNAWICEKQVRLFCRGKFENTREEASYLLEGTP